MVLRARRRHAQRRVHHAVPRRAIEINGAYKDGKLDGAWKRHYPGGALAEEGKYAAGQQGRHVAAARPTGAVLGEYTMKAGTGIEKRWFDDGPLYSERALQGRRAERHARRSTTHDGNVVITAQVRRRQARRADTSSATRPRCASRRRSSTACAADRARSGSSGLLVADENYDEQRQARRCVHDAAARARRCRACRARTTAASAPARGRGSTAKNNKEREGDYVDGKKAGAWFEWAENKLVFSGTFTDGKPDGDFVYSDQTATSSAGSRSRTAPARC